MKNTLPPIILGSRSPSRNMILRELGLEFSCMPVDIDEKAIRSEDLSELPILVARAKMDALKKLAVNETGKILLTGDSIVVKDGVLYEKPESEEELRQMLSSYSNSSALFTTALCLFHTDTQKYAEGISPVQVDFAEIPQDVIDQAAKDEQFYQAAGAIRVKNPLFEQCIKKIHGDARSVMGFPAELFHKLVQRVLQ